MSNPEGSPPRDRHDSPEARPHLLATFFELYHEAFSSLVDEVLHQDGRCLIVDVHSYPTIAPPYEIDPHLRPGLCVGTDPFHTPEPLARALEETARAKGVRTLRNRPFAGTFVPLPHYRTDQRITSVMLEIRRNLHMDESSDNPPEGLPNIVALVRDMIEAGVEAVGA